MIKSLSTQKVKIQEAMNSLMEEYYEEFSKRSNEPNFTINTIEELMLEQQHRIRELLITSNSELVSSVTVECKKNALNAEES